MQTPAFAATKTVRTWKLFRGLIWVAVVVAACLCPAPASAQTNSSWNGGVGTWSNQTNWNPGQVPNNNGANTYNVTIDSGGHDLVTLDQNATIDSLTLGNNSSNSISSTLMDPVGEAETLLVLGTITVNSSGLLEVMSGSTVTAANLTNSGVTFVGISGDPSTLTVTGTFTNNNEAIFSVGNGINVGTANIGELVMSPSSIVSVSQGSVLNLTNQPNGITDIPFNAELQQMGTINAGTHNGLAKLASIEGILDLWNGQSLRDSSNTLTIGDGGVLELAYDSSLSVANLTNTTEGTVSLGDINQPFSTNSLTVTGTFSNGAFATLNIGVNSTDTVNIKKLVNDGIVNIYGGSTLQVTSFGTMVGPSNGLPEINIESGASLVIASATATLAGDGVMKINGGMIRGAALGDELTNDITISGFGRIGDDSMGLVNDGTIIATGNKKELLIDTNSSGLNNQGQLTVNGATMYITGAANSFFNFDAASGTLTGGSYSITNGTLQFDNANIVTNAAKIILNGAQSRIIDQNGADGLANFASNATSGSFTLSGGRNFATSGAFSNAGSLTISKGSSFAVGGTANYTQTAGSTTVIGALSVSSQGNVNVSGGSVLDVGAINAESYIQTTGTTTVSGDLSVTGAVNVSGGSIVDSGAISAGNYTQTAGMTTVKGTLSATSEGVNVSGGLFFGLGTITGNIDLTGGLVSAGTASKRAGELTVDGTYAQSGAGALEVDLGGTTAGTQYDVLNITSTASLGGTLNVDLISDFKPTVGETFDIMDYTSETGTFTTLNLPKLTGGDTWSITYNATNVVLTVDGPDAKSGAPSGPAVKAVSRASTVASSTTAREPVAISSRATCFAERLIGTGSCDRASVTVLSHGPQVSAGTGVRIGEVHNNVMVATRSISSERGVNSHASSASATTMARLYLCAYLPSGVGHTMGCN